MRSAQWIRLVTIERVGLPLDLVAGIGQPDRGGGIADAARPAVVAFHRAELGGEISSRLMPARGIQGLRK